MYEADVIQLSEVKAVIFNLQVIFRYYTAWTLKLLMIRLWVFKIYVIISNLKLKTDFFKKPKFP
ncbi:hypothetical protein ADIWIN_3775 [Winogradskyella psychrotolerans RS-3]|uniref:Uncharacterized protein n=1 Tax=Winogradskyella psychrotolerans RS-3 TaxID=641526 RepID=S7WUI1_9FLAO|nr:hypothetical protein ADIWIN_3775 [Winogradskyella psychrotolerans RS-3]